MRYDEATLLAPFTCVPTIEYPGYHYVARAFGHSTMDEGVWLLAGSRLRRCALRCVALIPAGVLQVCNVRGR